MRSIVAAILLIAVAGCSGGSADGGSASGEADPNATLRIGALVVPSTLDPHQETSIGFRHALFPIWDTLFQLKNDKTVETLVAKEFAYNKAGGELTIVIRDGVTFHDGTAVDAAAVKGSLDRARGESSAPGISSRLSNISGIAIKDPSSIVLKLKTPDATLPATLAGMAGAIINPKFLDEDLTKAPAEAGSGPYIVTSFKPGEEVQFERAKEQWRPEAAKVKTMIIRAYPDSNAGVNAVETGELDMVNARVPIDVAEGVAKRNSNLKFFAFDTDAWGPALSFRNTVEPFDDKRVRQALLYAMDRDLLAEKVVGDKCEVTYQWFSEGSPAYIPDFKNPFPHDPAKAKALLEEAGVGNGFSFEVLYPSGFPVEQRVLESLKQMYAEVGVEITLMPVAIAELSARFTQKRDASMLTTAAAEGDPLLRIEDFLTGRFDLAGSEVDDFSAALTAARAPGNGRAAKLQEVNELATESALVTPICIQKNRWLASDKVTGLDDMRDTWTGIFNPLYIGVSK